MKKLLALLALVASSSFADTTANLITSGTTHTWTGVVTGAHPNDCCTGGPTPLYDPATNTIHFSYMQGTAAQTFAINQALANVGAGIQVQGYSYSWEINNLNGDNRQGGTDTLTATVLTYNAANTAIRRTDSWLYNTKFDWTTFSGDVSYVNPGTDFGNLTVKFSGSDGGFWGGYYGPKVRNVSLKMNYGVDLCTSNPLSSTSCAGYQQAYTDQQCASNPLYSTQCAGYAAAYQTQQCSANPLYSPTCVGYDTAYFNQQCSISPLYSQSCSGYSVAYHDQQCSINPLYATDCLGYDQAYLNAQCIRDSLYSKLCTGYATAYAIKYLVPVENSAGVNQVLSNNAAAVAAPPVPTPVESATTTPSTTSATSVTSVNSVVAPPPPPAGPTSVTTQTPPPPPPPAGAKEEPKPSGPPSARQALAERRQEAAKNEAVAKGKDLAKTMGSAKSMSDQVAAQGLVAAAMGYRPEFSAYQNSVVPDATTFYKPYTVYGGQKNVENRSTTRMFGGSEVKHQEMVNSQYNLGN